MIGPTSRVHRQLLSAIYIALGLLGQQALRGALTGATARQVCGALIVLMGVLFVLSPLIPRLAREWHVQSLMKRAGHSGPVLTGAAFAIAWTPCSGPTLGAIISATGTSSSAFKGAFLLAIYCAGLGVPFLITGLAFGKATAALNVVKRHYPIVIGLGGAVLIGMGILIWTDQFSVLNQHVSNWLTARPAELQLRHWARPCTPDSERPGAPGQPGARTLTPSNRGIGSLGMKAEELKGHLDGLILAVVSREPLHGYAVIEALKARSGGSLALPEGTVYPALHRLEDDGLLKSEWSTASGRRRRVYSITKRGEKELGASRERWRLFSSTIEAVLA